MSSSPTVLALAWQRYNANLRRRPLATKALTAGAIAGISDLIAQRLAGAGPLQLRRTALMALFGLLWSGPSAHYWQAFMERLFGSTQGWVTALRKARWLYHIAHLPV